MPACILLSEARCQGLSLEATFNGTRELPQYCAMGQKFWDMTGKSAESAKNQLKGSRQFLKICVRSK